MADLCAFGSALTSQQCNHLPQSAFTHQQYMYTVQSLLELGAFEVLLQLEAREGLGLASVLLKVLPILSLLALSQFQCKVQLQGRW